jgi:hypothetical protein
MRGLSYHELAYQVISKFVGPSDIPSSTLQSILEKSFSTFRVEGMTTTTATTMYLL